MADAKFLEAVKEIRKSEKKVNFDQTVDLIINLKNFDIRREAFSLFISVPHIVKKRKIAGFLEKDSSVIDTIKKEDFPRYKEKKDIKELVGKYDYFIASMKMMPAIATSFGRVLGPAGKMPSPQLGVLMAEDEKSIATLIEKINTTVRLKVKEPSIKVPIGKQSMKDEQIAENAEVVYKKVLDALPRRNESIRSILVKFTMDKPAKVQL
jgi:large subunit ribosomal protein L1